MKIYNCIILDDDEIDRLTVISYVKKFPFINIIATFSNPEECLEFCENNKVDILFLDIEMPKLSGLEIRKNCLKYQFAFISLLTQNTPWKVFSWIL